MRLTKEALKQIIKEELEVVLTNEEAGEIFGEEVQAQLEADEAASDPIVNPAGAEAAEADEEGAEALAALALREAEHEGEGSMARSQLARAGEIAHMLEKMIGDDTNLPEWVESKVTKAQDYLSSVLNYMRGEDLVDAGDAAREMKAAAAAVNRGPLQEDVVAEMEKQIRNLEKRIEALPDGKEKKKARGYLEVLETHYDQYISGR